ncbi:hypothetical protein CALVIDRAFT_569766 [Calocera viscosa TUFC12733]|uniref:Uncharacterized protein n=1 Tax=Calocera viscosa (strain TUFC12733) TaxID=1330018 RepID=A0A167FLW3_CALVF|nr:hypothetical protein CALVIDRAFT_569766 [Calocera viscosa TUFC12733]
MAVHNKVWEEYIELSKKWQDEHHSDSLKMQLGEPKLEEPTLEDPKLEDAVDAHEGKGKFTPATKKMWNKYKGKLAKIGSKIGMEIVEQVVEQVVDQAIS